MKNNYCHEIIHALTDVTDLSLMQLGAIDQVSLNHITFLMNLVLLSYIYYLFVVSICVLP